MAPSASIVTIHGEIEDAKFFAKKRPKRNIFPFLDVPGAPVIQQHHPKNIIFGFMNRNIFAHYIGIGSNKSRFKFKIDQLATDQKQALFHQLATFVPSACESEFPKGQS